MVSPRPELVEGRTMSQHHYPKESERATVNGPWCFSQVHTRRVLVRRERSHAQLSTVAPFVP